MLKKLRLFLILVSFTIVFSYSDCKKNDACNLPKASVNFTIDVTSVQYAGLNNIGGHVYVNGGNNGIIVYRVGLNQFYAYDRLCTYQSAGCLALTVDKTGLYLVDTYCKSKFSILNGAVINGPAKCNLITYQTYYDGVQWLQITN